VIRVNLVSLVKLLSMSSHDEPTLEQVAAQYPRWRVWRDFNKNCHAVPKDGPNIPVKGEDPLDLRDQIIRAESFREWGI
jgi:hypothetical protein